MTGTPHQQRDEMPRSAETFLKLVAQSPLGVEDQLRHSEEKYRTLFDSIDVGFCIIEVCSTTRTGPSTTAFSRPIPRSWPRRC
jgi:hypothetical protein